MDSDSDFYGDECWFPELMARVDNLDVQAWWDRRDGAPGQASRASRGTTTAPPTGERYNIYQKQPGAWQLFEPLDSYLDRLPPATTDWEPGFDWLRVANPYLPPGPDPDVKRFTEGGEERLALFAEFDKMATVNAARASGRTLQALKMDIAKERKQAVEDLLELAGRCGLVTGKWMLFPEPENVNEVWERVARATANNELGIGANVDTRLKTEKGRLVCVFTRDFRDRDDVARVLNRMSELELVRPGGKPIYYKTDAWTELGIYGNNPWGIKASLYSSTEIFSYINNSSSSRS